MDLNQFVNASAGNALLQVNRLFANWVVLRATEIEKHRFVRLHRLSSRRIVLEVKVAEGKRSRKLALVSVFVVIAVCVVGGSISMLAKTGNEAAQAISKPSVKPDCDFGSIANQSVENLESFSAGEWLLNSVEPARLLGGLASVRVEAVCADRTLQATVLARKTKSGWQLKQMVPIN